MITDKCTSIDSSSTQTVNRVNSEGTVEKTQTHDINSLKGRRGSKFYRSRCSLLIYLVGTLLVRLIHRLVTNRNPQHQLGAKIKSEENEPSLATTLFTTITSSQMGNINSLEDR